MITDNNIYILAEIKFDEGIFNEYEYDCMLGDIILNKTDT
jgi:hypothetical protein